MENLYDLIIIGAGPAGLAAGIYGGRAQMSTIILEKDMPGGQAARTNELVNYPGSPHGSTGPQMMAEWVSHAMEFGVKLKTDEVIDLDLEGEIKTLTTKKGKAFQAPTVIIATGAEPNKLNIPGVEEFTSHGVSYCATCDAPFYKDKKVVVIGSGDAAIEEGIFLTRFAKEVQMVVIHEEGVVDANHISAEKAFKNEKMTWVWNSAITEVKGDQSVNAVMLKNINTGEITEVATDGVFFFIGSKPKTDFLQGKIELNDRGYIVTNDEMETSVDGVFAAGDVRDKYLRQVVTSANDGAVAATAAEKYIAENETFKNQIQEAKELVLLSFWAPEVEKSVSAVSTLEQVIKDLKENIKLVKMDSFHNRRLARLFNIKDVPQAVLLKQGQEIGRLDDDFSAEAVNKMLNNINL